MPFKIISRGKDLSTMPEESKAQRKMKKVLQKSLIHNSNLMFNCEIAAQKKKD